jgi:hypothetical protein
MPSLPLVAFLPARRRCRLGDVGFPEALQPITVDFIPIGIYTQSASLIEGVVLSGV